MRLSCRSTCAAGAPASLSSVLGASALVALAGQAPAIAGDGGGGFDVRVVIKEGDLLPDGPTVTGAQPRSLGIAQDGSVAVIVGVVGGGEAIVTDRTGVIELVARTSTAAPGTDGFYDDFTSLKYAGDSSVVFRASLAGDLVDCNNNGFAENDHALFTDTGAGPELIFREDDPLPGAAPFRAALIGNLTASPFDGAYGTFVSTRTGTCPFFTEDNSIYMVDLGQGIEPLVIPGEIGPLEDSVFGSTAQLLRRDPNDLSSVTFGAALAGEGFEEANDFALITKKDGEFKARLRESDPVPGMPGLTIGPIFRWMSERSDVFSWVADLRTTSGGFTFTDAVLRVINEGEIEVLAVEDEPAPLIPGATLRILDPFDPPTTENSHTIGGADDGSTAFRAVLDGVSEDSDNVVYYVDAAGHFSIILRTNDTPPGYDEQFSFGVFDFFTFTPFGKPFMNRSGQVTFVGRIQGPGVQTDSGALFFFDPAIGEAQKVLGPGDVIDIAGDGSDPREVIRVESLGPIGQSPAGSPFSDTGEVGFVAQVAGGPDGETTVVLVASPAGRGCVADFNGDGALSVLDFVAFQGAFSSGDESADVNGDGALNVLDFVAFQAEFEAGCG